MYNRTLQRPMFRMGGSTGTGITTGLRQGYKRGRVVEPGGYSGEPENIQDWNVENKTYETASSSNPQQRVASGMDIVNAIAPPNPYAASDFFMNLGQGILAQPGGQPIFQAIGKAAGPALSNLQKTRIGEAQGKRNMALALYKNLDEAELNAIEELVPYYMKTFNTDRDGAIKMIVEERRYSKSGRKTDEQTRTERIDFLEKSILGEPGASKKYIGSARDMATHIYKVQNDEYEGLTAEDFVPGKPWIKSGDVSEQKRDADGQVTTYKISETSIPSFQGYEGKIFYDLKTGRLFKKQGTQFVAVVEINAE